MPYTYTHTSHPSVSADRACMRPLPLLCLRMHTPPTPIHPLFARTHTGPRDVFHTQVQVTQTHTHMHPSLPLHTRVLMLTGSTCKQVQLSTPHARHDVLCPHEDERMYTL